MATTQQAIAYKANAARSTGPKTGGGKARVGGNALKHGLQSSISYYYTARTPQSPGRIGRRSERRTTALYSIAADPVQSDCQQILAVNAYIANRNGYSAIGSNRRTLPIYPQLWA